MYLKSSAVVESPFFTASVFRLIIDLTTCYYYSVYDITMLAGAPAEAVVAALGLAVG